MTDIIYLYRNGKIIYICSYWMHVEKWIEMERGKIQERQVISDKEIIYRVGKEILKGIKII